MLASVPEGDDIEAKFDDKHNREEVFERLADVVPRALNVSRTLPTQSKSEEAVHQGCVHAPQLPDRAPPPGHL